MAHPLDPELVYSYDPNLLASGCPSFVSSTYERRSGTLRGCDYYVQADDDIEFNIPVAHSFVDSGTNKTRYILDRTFVVQYSSMFDLGDVSSWSHSEYLKRWLKSLTFQVPRFIPPFVRAVNQHTRNDTTNGDLICWFVAPILLQVNAFRLGLPVSFQRHMPAPRQAVVMINSGLRTYHAKLENYVITIGWDTIVNDHGLGFGNVVLFASVGHLMFDIYVFDREGNNVAYNWSTAQPIRHLGAPAYWDPITVLEKITKSTITTSCLPSVFRGISSGYQFCKKLNIKDLVAMEMSFPIRELALVYGLHEFILKTGHESWRISYADGYLEGTSWQAFVIAHDLEDEDVIVFSFDFDLALVTMIFNRDGCERPFFWYKPDG